MWQQFMYTLILAGTLVAHEQLPVALTPPHKVQDLYQTMKDVHELCTDLGITYWVDAGSLLGAVRHQGLIPWDNDLDLCILEEHVPILLTHAKTLKQYGYALKEAAFGYKLIRNGCHCDLFVVCRRQERYYYADKYTSTYFALRNNGPLYILHDEIYPLAPYTFGPLTVWGPKSPHAYLDAYYPGWQCTVRFLTDNMTNEYAEHTASVSALQDIMALPGKPLEDRIAPS